MKDFICDKIITPINNFADRHIDTARHFGFIIAIIALIVSIVK